MQINATDQSMLIPGYQSEQEITSKNNIQKAKAASEIQNLTQ